MPVACTPAQLRKPSTAEPTLSDQVSWANRSSVIWLSSGLVDAALGTASPVPGFGTSGLSEIGVSDESAGWLDRPTRGLPSGVSSLADPVSATLGAISGADWLPASDRQYVASGQTAMRANEISSTAYRAWALKRAICRSVSAASEATSAPCHTKCRSAALKC